MEYNPEIHGRVKINAQYRAECKVCGWVLAVDDLCVGDPLPPESVACPNCFLMGAWKPIRVKRI